MVRFLDDPGPIKLPLSPAHTARLRQEVFKVPGAFNSVGVDQSHAGFKVTYINLEVGTWLVEGQATTALEYLDPVFPFLNFASSEDIRFCFGFFVQFSWGDYPGNSPPGFDVVPAGWGTMSIPRARLGFRT